MSHDEYILGTFDSAAPFNQPADKEERCELCRFWTYEVELIEFEGLHICPQCAATEAEAEKIREALC
jgi:hypothetical protein